MFSLWLHKSYVTKGYIVNNHNKAQFSCLAEINRDGSRINHSDLTNLQIGCPIFFRTSLVQSINQYRLCSKRGARDSGETGGSYVSAG